MFLKTQWLYLIINNKTHGSVRYDDEGDVENKCAREDQISRHMTSQNQATLHSGTVGKVQVTK